MSFDDSDIKTDFDDNINYYNKIYCINCGKKGHKIKNCNFPIVSYGIICINIKIDNIKLKFDQIVKYINNNDYDINLCNLYYNHLIKVNNYDNIIKYLMINRKHSLNYIEIIRGKYDIDNLHYLINSINYITKNEKNLLLTKDFDYLWSELWNNKFIKNGYDNEFEKSKDKFNKLTNGILFNNFINIDFNYIINKCKFDFIDTEWEFPKGRKNTNENDLDCAIREFYEETNIDIHNIQPLSFDKIDEVFMGTNYSKYKNIYYLYDIIDDKIIDKKKNKFQKLEINDVKWLNINECFDKIRDYHFEKKNTLYYIHFILTNILQQFISSYKKNNNLT